MGRKSTKKKNNHIYNLEERQIARRITDMKRQQHHYQQRYQELDMKLNLLKPQLNGKYQEQI